MFNIEDFDYRKNANFKIIENKRDVNEMLSFCKTILDIAYLNEMDIDYTPFEHYVSNLKLLKDTGYGEMKVHTAYVKSGFYPEPQTGEI